MSTGQGATADAIASATESGNAGQELVYLQVKAGSSVYCRYLGVRTDSGEGRQRPVIRSSFMMLVGFGLNTLPEDKRKVAGLRAW